MPDVSRNFWRDYESSTPDLTTGGFDDDGCGDRWRSATCTRRRGHTGRHAAGNGTQVVAVWASKEDGRPDVGVWDY